ncbi:MAG: MFS transporter [Actinobacteria bacterium]|jgi:MFS family permease|nr:MFS transporter [Actinomycetota bacterium]MDP7549789.1 MFS transporter [Acidimicrobiales bacterium]MBT3687436.1 MFS transporter [Actinomycetota bacterium]MBT4038268.1 MFS transporter [Actinomycetota bacterium]MBT4279159.1 MFS transporter [Actinomycetota bacterium]|tara:strand:+ start:6378 stop:7625 length:1248 start_codon:yes stop_codon:yes gene_type:complete
MDPVALGRFPALRVRNYRLFWIGGLISNNGRWVQFVATYYVIFQMTGSAAWIGAAGFASFIPMLLVNPVAGYMSDNLDRRNALLWASAASAAVSSLLVVAWVVGVDSPWIWVGLFFARGAVAGLRLPIWQAFVSECVPRRHLRNAITLNSTQFNAARTLGPAIGGLVIGLAGPGWALLLAVVLNGPVIVALGMMDRADLNRPSGPPGAGTTEGRSILADYRESIRYVAASPGIRTAIMTVTLIATISNPIVTQLVVFAEEVFEVSPFWFGVLGSAQGLGAVMAAPLVAGELGRVRRSRLQLAATVGYGLAVMLFGLAPVFWVGFLALGAIGAMHLTSASNLNSSVQLQVDDAVRGRVMAIYLMGVLGTTPFANLAMGWLISAFGPRPVVTTGGLIMVIGGLVLFGTGRLQRLDND